MKRIIVGTTIIIIILSSFLMFAGSSVAQPNNSTYPYPIGAYLYENVTTAQSNTNIPGGYIGMNSTGILPSQIVVYFYASGNSTVTLINTNTSPGTPILNNHPFFRNGTYSFNLLPGNYLLQVIVTSGLEPYTVMAFFHVEVMSIQQYINYLNKISQKSSSLTVSISNLAGIVIGVSTMAVGFSLMSGYIAFRIDWELSMRTVTKELKN